MNQTVNPYELRIEQLQQQLQHLMLSDEVTVTFLR